MRRTPVRLALILTAGLIGAPPAPAETPAAKPPAPAAADEAFDAAKAAFLALPLPARKAAQDALVWLGLYNGPSDGAFGKRTRDSIAAFQVSQKGPGDGVLTAGQRQALTAAGERARAAVGFKTIVDARSGARIGAPTKLIGANSGVTLDFASDASGDLAGLYQRLSAETPSRKVAYKAIKPGAFFVVSGREGGRRFYTRAELSAAANPPIRGFTFAYPAARADLDRVALAVANAFDPFPGQGPAATAATPAAEPPAAPPQPPEPTATALFIARDRALTVLKADACPSPTIGGAPARFERSDAATGLALLSGDFGAKAEPPARGALAADLLVMSADGSRVAAVPAALASGGRPIVVASLAKSAAGAPAFDRSGRLVGLVAPIADEPKRVGGVALAAPHALIEAEAIGTFLGGGALTPIAAADPLSAGAIAARTAKTVAAVTCAR